MAEKRFKRFVFSVMDSGVAPSVGLNPGGRKAEMSETSSIRNFGVVVDGVVEEVVVEEEVLEEASSGKKEEMSATSTAPSLASVAVMVWSLVSISMLKRLSRRGFVADSVEVVMGGPSGSLSTFSVVVTSLLMLKKKSSMRLGGLGTDAKVEDWPGMMAGATSTVSWMSDRDRRVVVSIVSSSVVRGGEVTEEVVTLVVEEKEGGGSLVVGPTPSLTLTLWEVWTDATTTELSVEFVTRTSTLLASSPLLLLLLLLLVMENFGS